MFTKFIILWIVLFALSFFIEETPKEISLFVEPIVVKEPEIVYVEKVKEEKKPQPTKIYRKGYIGYPQQYQFAA